MERGLSFFASLILFAIIVGLAYIFTKYFASKYNTFLNGKNIKVIENISLGKDNHLYLIKVGESCLLIGTSGKSITCLKELNKDEINLEISENNNPIQFKNYFSVFMENYKNNRKNNDDNDYSFDKIDDFIEDTNHNDNDEEIDYSFKSKLNKLNKNKEKL